MIVDDTESMANITDELKVAICEFEHNISEVSNISMETYHKVTYTQMVAEITLAKVNQMMYVQQGYRIVEIGTNSDAASAVIISHTACDLGQSLHTGKGVQQYGYLPSFKKIELPHEVAQKFIFMAHKHLDEPWQMSPKFQAQIVDNFQGIEDNSIEITTLLDSILDKKQHFEASTSESEIDLF